VRKRRAELGISQEGSLRKGRTAPYLCRRHWARYQKRLASEHREARPGDGADDFKAVCGIWHREIMTCFLVFSKAAKGNTVDNPRSDVS